MEDPFCTQLVTHFSPLANARYASALRITSGNTPCNIVAIRRTNSRTWKNKKQTARVNQRNDGVKPE
jgi:hypothetical protein